VGNTCFFFESEGELSTESLLSSTVDSASEDEEELSKSEAEPSLNKVICSREGILKEMSWKVSRVFDR